MKLLRVIPSLDPLGGGPVASAQVTDAELLRRGHSVEVVCLDSPGQEFLQTYPARVHALGPSHLGYRYNSQLAPWIRNNRGRFDAAIVDGLWQYHGFGAWRALAGTSTPYFVFTHGMLDPWFKYTHRLKHLKKWLYWPWAEYRLLRDARAVFFTCQEEMTRSRLSFSLYNCVEEVAALGVAGPADDLDILRELFFSEYPELRGKELVLFVGRIHPIKGCDLLIEAFARAARHVDKLHLVMVGPDQAGWYIALEELAKRLRIASRITWTGMLVGERKWGAYNAASVFCLPSHHENFGLVVAEALACGKPVLISNKVNIWREIEADGAGIVQDDTLEGTTTALRQWLALTPGAKEQMQRSARECFNARFRIDRVAESLINMLQQHISPPRAPDVAERSGELNGPA